MPFAYHRFLGPDGELASHNWEDTVGPTSHLGVRQRGLTPRPRSSSKTSVTSLSHGSLDQMNSQGLYVIPMLPRPAAVEYVSALRKDRRNLRMPVHHARFPPLIALALVVPLVPHSRILSSTIPLPCNLPRHLLFHCLYVHVVA